MNWRYEVHSTHTHVRVFMNGAKCGDLCFRNEEFNEILSTLRKCPTILMLRDGEAPLITPVNESK
jgi:hypothetical protein